MSADATPPKATARRRSNGVTVQTSQPAPQGDTNGFSVSFEPASEVNRLTRVGVRLPSGQEVELTRTVVAAIAHALWQARGEDHLTNWLDAETAFNLMMGVRQCSASGVNGMRAGRKAVSIDKRPAAADDGDLLPALASRSSRLRRL
jgi:hypothetical protein